MQFEERMFTITADSQEMRDEMAAKKQSVKDLGNPNLAAPEEYQAEEDRRILLSEQKADVVKALEHLKVLKAEEQAEATERFLDTYNKIKRNFHNMFRRLFGGGQAQLQLADGSNVLQSGIEIFAQPPGKKLENISLLSGGEKTMTAVALLFATYMVHPSPFCLLDEIDAALDEANVGRFVAILNEFSSVSQYFVITHNRRTALGARTLIGITMAESGVSTKLDVRLSEGGDPDFVAADITPVEEEDVPPEEGIVIPPHPPRRQAAGSGAGSRAMSETPREEVPNAAP
jgi:chromosome segregation protein